MLLSWIYAIYSIKLHKKHVDHKKISNEKIPKVLKIKDGMEPLALGYSKSRISILGHCHF